MRAQTSSLQTSLDALVAVSGIIAATLVTRDGLCLARAGHQVGAPETFAAMAATLFASSEVAMQEARGDRTLHVIVEANHHRLVATPVDDGFLLVALTRRDVPTEGALDSLTTVARGLRGGILGGAA